jgi:tRNA-specific 2-thiouridylase
MKILVGLSGGVDSAVAAWLLKEQGHDVTCCFMRNWDSFANNDIMGNPTIMDDVCPQEQDYMDALAVANHLGLKLERVDFIKEYWDDVFSTFVKEYAAGRTPNPDILCNKYIKFDAFYNYAMERGYEAVATGHYCSNINENGYAYLGRAADTNKDQTYFLCQVPEKALAHTLFPLGKITKPEVREIAARLQLESVASKKDSTGICFIGERNFRDFLKNYIPAQEGDIIEIETGRKLGEHVGVMYYTIGQRKGLNITRFAGPWFVAGKDIETRRLFVTKVDQQHWLESDTALVTGINWLVKDKAEIPAQLTAKFRYRQPDQNIELEWVSDTSVLVHYPQKIKAVTPGQEAVFYDGMKCLGGGVIEKVWIDGEDVQEKILKEVNRHHG